LGITKTDGGFGEFVEGASASSSPVSINAWSCLALTPFSTYSSEKSIQRRMAFSSWMADKTHGFRNLPESQKIAANI